MAERRIDELIAALVAGDIDAAGREELAGLVERDAGAARMLDEELRLEALLLAAHLEAPGRGRLSAGVRSRLRPRRRLPLVLAAAAAMLLAAATGTWLGLRRDIPPQPPEVGHVLVAGEALVNGAPAGPGPVFDGARVEAGQTGPAELRLADGSQTVLAAGSAAVLRGPVEDFRQLVELEKGRGEFEVESGAGRFRVKTEMGNVTVVGTKFSVELRPPVGKGEGEMLPRAGLVLFVAVTIGIVNVEYDGSTYRLTDGMSRAFGEEGGDMPAEASALPEGVRGFSGQVRGTVAAKTDRGIMLKVAEVLKVWQKNQASNPGALAGLTVSVGPSWFKGDDGKWHPAELQQKFLRKLQVGQELVLEIKNVERDQFAVLELNQEQRAWAAAPAEGGGDRQEGKDRPQGGGDREGGDLVGQKMVCSDGPVEATITCTVLGRERATLQVKVEKIEGGEAKWRHPKTGEKQMVVGEKGYFAAQWEIKDKKLNPKDGGNWQPSRHEMGIIEKLRPGDRIEVGAYFQEHPRLRYVTVLERGGGDRPREGGDRPKAESDRPKEGGDRPKEGGDQPKEGGDGSDESMDF